MVISWLFVLYANVTKKESCETSLPLGLNLVNSSVTTPLLEECEDDTHIPEMGTWESFETPKT
jgi:hypothetical protein